MKTMFYIIDFDSTFVTVETLEELANIALKGNPQKTKIFEKMQTITKQGMEGKITYSESLSERFKLFQANKTHIKKLTTQLKKQITPSVKLNNQFFKQNADQIFIITGGFKEYVWPIVKKFGLAENHVLANSFIFDKKGNIIGFDKTNPLSREGGKPEKIKQLKLEGDIYVIGDGITDYQIKEKNKSAKFFAFTENIERPAVMAKADEVIKTFDEFLFKLHLPRSQSYPKSLMKVLLLENIDEQAVELFKREGYTVEKLKKALNENELIEKAKDVSVIGIRSKTQITEKVVKKLNKLLAVGAYCIGTNQIELKACAQNGVAVFNAPYSNTRSVVELALGEIIMLYRKTFDKSSKLHQGIWDKSAAGSHEIRGKTLGIVGYGNIGSQLSVLAEGLGMNVYFYDAFDRLALGNAKKCELLEELLKISDVVTIHVDGRKSNTNLIGEKEFSIMKDGVIFLNLSRGFVVDMKALETNLKKGKIAGAAVDVFPQEPKSTDEPFTCGLQNIPNVILTPHVAGSTIEAQRNIADFVTQKIQQFIDTGNTTLSVNYPNIQLPELTDAHRFIHIHKNVPGILAQLNNIFAKYKINIEGQYLKTNEEIGYVITDVNKNYSRKVIDELKSIPETIRVRILY